MIVDFNKKIKIDFSGFVKFNLVYLKSLFRNTDVLPFWVAETDFKVPSGVSEALKKQPTREFTATSTKRPFWSWASPDGLKNNITSMNMGRQYGSEESVFARMNIASPLSVIQQAKEKLKTAINDWYKKSAPCHFE